MAAELLRTLVGRIRGLVGSEPQDCMVSTEIDAKLRVAEIVVLMQRLHQQMLGRRSLDDLQAFVAEIPRVLKKSERKTLMKGLAMVVQNGDPLGFLVVECAKWLCMDTRMRRSLLVDTDFVEVLVGGLRTVAMASADALLPQQLAYLQVTMDFFMFVDKLDPHYTEMKLSRAKADKVLSKVGTNHTGFAPCCNLLIRKLQENNNYVL